MLILLWATLLGLITAIIGSVPLGLVNLYVVKETIEVHKKSALRIAAGATFIELVYGITALLAASYLYRLVQDSIYVSLVVVALLLLGGVFFLKKKHNSQSTVRYFKNRYLFGAFLNLISVQVFIYWIVALTIILNMNLISLYFLTNFFFLSGLIIGKYGVLWMFSFFSHKLITKSNYVARNINKIIGTVLIIVAIIQVIII